MHRPASSVSLFPLSQGGSQAAGGFLAAAAQQRRGGGRVTTKHEKHATDTRTQGEAAVVREERRDGVTCDASMSTLVTCLVCLLLARLHPALAAVVGNDTEYDEYEEFLHPVQVRSRAEDAHISLMRMRCSDSYY